MKDEGCVFGGRVAFFAYTCTALRFVKCMCRDPCCVFRFLTCLHVYVFPCFPSRKKYRLFSGGSFLCRFFADFLCCFFLANLFIRNKRNQRAQCVVDTFGIWKIFRHIRFKGNCRSIVLHGNCAVFVVNADCVAFLPATIVFSMHTFFAREIILGQQAVIYLFHV